MCTDRGLIRTYVHDLFPAAGRFSAEGLPRNLSLVDRMEDGNRILGIEGTPRQSGNFTVYISTILGSTTLRYPIRINVTQPAVTRTVIGGEELDYTTETPGDCISNFNITGSTFKPTENTWITKTNVVDRQYTYHRFTGTAPNVTQETTIEFVVSGRDGFNVYHQIPINFIIQVDSQPNPFPPTGLIAVDVGAFVYRLPKTTGGNGPLTYTTNIANVQPHVYLSTLDNIPYLYGYTSRPVDWKDFKLYATDINNDQVFIDLKFRSVNPLRFRRTSALNFDYNIGETVEEYFDLAIGGLSPITYTLEGVLPNGLTLDSELVILEGEPTSRYDGAHFLVATDSRGISVSRKIIITVDFDLFADEDEGPFTARIGQRFEHSFFTIDNGDFLTLTASTLPQGMYIAPKANLAESDQDYELVLAGYPKYTSSATSYTVTLTDTTGGTDTVTFELTVLSNPNSHPTTTTSSRFVDNTGPAITTGIACGPFDYDNHTYTFINGYYSEWELPAATPGTGEIRFRFLVSDLYTGFSTTLTYGLTMNTITRTNADGTRVYVPVVYGYPTTRPTREVYHCLEVLNDNVVTDRIQIRIENYRLSDFYPLA